MIIVEMFLKKKESNINLAEKDQKTKFDTEKANGTGGNFFWEITKTVLGFLLFLVIFRFYIYQPFSIDGSSMEPSFQDKEYLVVNELSYHLGNPKRGDVVIFKHPEPICNQFVSASYFNRVIFQGPCSNYIKRIIGLPGETIIIRDGKIIIKNNENSEGFTLKEDYILNNIPTLGSINKKLGDSEYFVLGDNRTPNASSDSREWGVLPRTHIVGKAFLVLLPFDHFEAVAKPGF